jgi:homoserine dehydrogenase
MKPLGIGLLGLGTVGAEVFRLLADTRTLTDRAGVPIAVARVAVAHADKRRRVPVPAPLLTTDASGVVESREVDVVVELIGGLDPARGLVLRALSLGKAVVTANKQLLAHHGPELFNAPAGAAAELRFEGSVGAGIPIIKPISESLAAARIHSITGILNGTTNYILTRMNRDGWSYADALDDARRQGLAEADPTEDVEGHDAAAKLAILASVAFGARVTNGDVFREGITRITPRDLAYAKELGFTVKLLAIGRERDGVVETRVHPALIPLDHPLALVADEFNAVEVEADGLGPVVFSGRGAGGAPTAVAVVGDIVDVARDRALGRSGRTAGVPPVAKRLRPIEDVILPYYVSLQVTDRPGVFARVAAIFGEEQVSIASLVQKSRGQVADVVLVTHDAPERAVRRVLDRLRALEVVAAINNVIRVEATL